MTYCTIITTCPTRDEALSLSEKLVSFKLAACVQIHPIESIYSWKGSIHHEPEFRLTLKTRRTLYHRIESMITEHHGYDVPEIIQIPIETGSEKYLDWIGHETGNGTR